MTPAKQLGINILNHSTINMYQSRKSWFKLVTASIYPLVFTNMASWKSTFSNRKYIYKRWIFHSDQINPNRTNLDFSQIRGPISLLQLPFQVRSCEVAIIWPDCYVGGPECIAADPFSLPSSKGLLSILWLRLWDELCEEIHDPRPLPQCAPYWYWLFHGNLRGPPKATFTPKK